MTSLTRTSQTDANDFLFAGKAQILTDGTNTQIFPTSNGYVMKAKTIDLNHDFFSFPDGYSLSLANTCTVNFVTTSVVSGYDGGGLSKANTVP